MTPKPSLGEQTLRKKIVTVGRRLFDHGLIVATDGNLSVRLGPKQILITPAQLSKADLKPSDLIVVDMDGRPATRGRRRPSSELPMHLEVYRQVSAARAVIHAHPPFATALTVAGIPFPGDVLPETAVTIGEVPTTDLAMPGSEEDAAAIRPLITEHRALLLRQHGSLTYGASLDEACDHLERMEHAARVFWLAHSLGRVQRLPPELMARLDAYRRRAGAEGNSE